MNTMRAPGVLNIVGSSDSGKTTLIEKLLPIFKECFQMKVSVIKHSHHQIEFEPKHKDSARFRLGGAHEVMVVSPYRWGIFSELKDESEPDVEACISRLARPDLVLIEGFRRSHYPKLEVYRPELGKPPIFESDDSITVVASPVATKIMPCYARIDLDDPMQIAFWILENALHPKESSHEQE